MSKIVDEVIAANKKYASGFGAKKDLALPPARGFAILTCMDARLDPAKYAGLSEGDAHVIRNAGGRASKNLYSMRSTPKIPITSLTHSQQRCINNMNATKYFYQRFWKWFRPDLRHVWGVVLYPIAPPPCYGYLVKTRHDDDGDMRKKRFDG
jgi:hypothetical protein